MATAIRRTALSPFESLQQQLLDEDPYDGGGQQTTNQQTATRQAQQFAQEPFFQAEAPQTRQEFGSYQTPGYQVPNDPYAGMTGTTGQGLAPTTSQPPPSLSTRPGWGGLQPGVNYTPIEPYTYETIVYGPNGEQTPTTYTVVGWRTGPTGTSFQPVYDWEVAGYGGSGGTGFQPTPTSGAPQQTFQSLVASLPPTVQSLQSIFPTIQQMYPGAQLQGGDIWFPGIGWVDVLQNAAQGGTGWQWLPDAQSGGGGGGTLGAAPLPGSGGQFFDQQSRSLNFGAQPTYQTYQFSPRSVAPTGDLTSLASRLVGQLGDQAGQLWNMAPVDTTAQRAQAQDFYTQAAEDARTMSRERSAQQGIQGGIPQARLASIDDALGANLGRAYGNIEMGAEQQDFANYLAAQQALGGAAGQAGALGGQLFGQDLASGQFDFQQQLAQAAENRGGFDANLAAQLGLGGLNLQQLLGLENLNMQQTGLQQQALRDWYNYVVESMR